MPEEEKRRDGEGFLSAWSRRKRAAARAETEEREAAAEAKAPEAQTATDADAHALAEAEPEITEEELAALPTVDEITGSTDLQPFMKRGVPDVLRKAAMRKVWLSNSLICDHDDPAVDYAWDWNGPEGVPGAGGILQGDKVSKMVDDLVNRGGRDRGQKEPEKEASDRPDSTPNDEEGSEGDAKPADGGTDTMSQAEPGLPTDPLRRGGPSAMTEAPGKSVSEPDKAGARDEQRNATTASMPPRRHGSAIPD